MKLNLGKLGSTIIRIGAPIVVAAVVHQATTGKLDLKGATLDALAGALEKRKV